MARKRTTTPTRPDDARTQRSIDALRAAFLDLIERKPIELISIKEITDAAGLSYPTFFRRYSRKEELLTEIATEEVRRLLGLGESAFHSRSRPNSAVPLCKYISAHRKLWRTLLTGGAAPAMREEFTRVAREIGKSRPRINPAIPLELAEAFVTSAIFEILAWWMHQPDDYPMENVATLLEALVINVIASTRDIKLIEPGSAKKAPTNSRRPHGAGFKRVQPLG